MARRPVFMESIGAIGRACGIIAGGLCSALHFRRLWAVGNVDMEKRFRLRKSGDFQLVRGQGRSWVHPLLVLYARRNDLAQTRVGISVSKRIGNAVVRNRVKRVVREATRLRLERVRPGWDVIFVARVPIASADFATVGAAIEQLLRRSGLLSGPPAQEWVARRATGVAQGEPNPPAPGG